MGESLVLVFPLFYSPPARYTLLLLTVILSHSPCGGSRNEASLEHLSLALVIFGMGVRYLADLYIDWCMFSSEWGWSVC